MDEQQLNDLIEALNRLSSALELYPKYLDFLLTFDLNFFMQGVALSSIAWLIGWAFSTSYSMVRPPRSKFS